MKRVAPSSSPESTAPAAKRRKVSFATFSKWKADCDKSYKTVSWLGCISAVEGGGRMVSALTCSVCTKFVEQIKGRRNFNEKWISGAESLRISNVLDHAKCDQHKHAMILLKKEQAISRGLDATSYAPIAKALNSISQEDKERLKRKFDIAHFVVSEKLSFKKYSRICALEKKHGVDLGSTYLNDVACRTFIHFIAEVEREKLKKSLGRADYFSLLLDGSVDKGLCDNEVVMAVWCDINSTDEKIHSRIAFFNVVRPLNVTGQGLFEVLETALKDTGIPSVDAENCYKLVGIATDGASANIARGGHKGLVEDKLPWIFWMWCLAHQMELAIKDALTGTSFDGINEMLMRLYYLYEKSPKKSRELEEVVKDLKECFQFHGSGNKPIRASGSRWVTHKLNALRRVLSHYGAYTCHIAALSKESSVKSSDRAKLHGYHTKWTDGQYLLGCAFFTDLLTPCSIFSKVMQSDDVDILAALTSVLKTLKETERLSSKHINEWPTYAATLKKIACEEENYFYQCQAVKKLPEAKTYYQNHFEEYCSKVTECIQSRMKWCNVQFLRDIIFVLGSQGWEKVVDENESLVSVDRIVERFSVPLGSAGVDTSLIAPEFFALMQYAVQFISISTLDYRAVWWRLFHAPNASEWYNVLALVKLLFSLPSSNAKVERAFSQLNLIKTNKRTLITNDTLRDLLALGIDPVPMEDFCADDAVDIWWRNKTRRPNQKVRKPYQPYSRSSTGTTASSSTSTTACSSTGSEMEDYLENSENENESNCLQDWDKWMCDSDSD